VYEVSSQAVEVFASRICIPIKASYGIAVVPYALMESCPVSARMRNAGGPFLLEGLRVLRHILFIYLQMGPPEFIVNLYSRSSGMKKDYRGLRRDLFREPHPSSPYQYLSFRQNSLPTY
jgi:hypothetical protein